MGVLDAFKLKVPGAPSSIGVAAGVPSIVSPWSQVDHFSRLVMRDVFGYDIPVSSRDAAMKLDPIARGRNLLCASISSMPLVELGRGETEPDPARQPSWISQPGGGISPQHRLAYTVDDLIFHGWSCWWRENSASTGFPLSVTRIPWGQWWVTPDMQMMVNGVPVRDDQVILIPGLHEGILNFGDDVLREARNLQTLVSNRLKSPVPPVVLKQIKGKKLTAAERRELAESWIEARAAGIPVGFATEELDVIELQGDDGKLMVEERNAAAVSLARVIGVTAGLLDATAPKASLNYETKNGRNEEFVDRDCRLYMLPITSRLSLDDVTPHGRRSAFHLTDWTGPAMSPTGPRLED